MTNISISYLNKLSKDRNFLFELELSKNYNLDLKDDIFTHVVNAIINFIQIKNTTNVSITLFRNVRLDTIMKYLANKYY